MKNNKLLYESIMRDVSKIIRKHLYESENNNDIEFNISKFNNGSKDSVNLMKKIVNSIKDIDNDTNINIDCGKLGLLSIKFTDKNKSQQCNISIVMKDLSKYVKFDSDIENEFNKKLTFKDGVLIMQNVINTIKSKIK